MFKEIYMTFRLKIDAKLHQKQKLRVENQPLHRKTVVDFTIVRQCPFTTAGT